MRATGSPVHTSRIIRSAAAASSGVDRPARNNRASPTYRDSLRARPGHPATARSNPVSARPLTSAPPQTPPSVRRRQSHGEVPQRARGRQSHGERRPQSDEHNRTRASTSTVSRTARLPARPSRRQELQDSNISAGAGSPDSRTQSLPRWHSVSAGASSHDGTAHRGEQNNPRLRPGLQSESPRSHSQHNQMQSLAGQHSVSVGTASQNEHALLEEEISNSLMSISAGLHSVDEQAPANDEARSVVLRSPRRFVMETAEESSAIFRPRLESESPRAHSQHNQMQSLPGHHSVSAGTASQNEHASLEDEISNSLMSISAGLHSVDELVPANDATRSAVLRPPRRFVMETGQVTSLTSLAPAPVFECTPSEDSIQNQIESGPACNVGSQTGNSSTSNRCPLSNLPRPSEHHDHTLEDAMRVSRNIDSPHGVAPTMPATSGSRLSPTRIAGSEISGMYRRPRRPRNSRVEEESVVLNLAASGSDYNPETHRTEAPDNILQNYSASASDSIGLRNESILNGLRQTARASVANNDHMERPANEPPMPNVAASGSRRAAKGKKKIQSRNTKPGTSDEKARSSSDSSPVDDCPICLAPLVGKCGKTRCGHNFHIDCLEQHLLVTAVDRPTCPICRGELRLKLPVSAEATSGNAMEVLHRVPPEESRCHLDRGYTFLSLGSFAEMPKMLYVRTSNEDKWTPPNAVMWTLTASVPTTVYLNFRSIEHVTETGAMKWLNRGGWAPSDVESTVSTGWPNGPYEGPVFAKDFEAGQIELMGSNCHEGTYFVFVELRNKSEFDALPWDLSQILE